MAVQGTYENFAIDRVVYGRPAAQTVATDPTAEVRNASS